MTDQPPVNLDERRGESARTSVESRRSFQEFQAQQVALRRRREEIEGFLAAAPAPSWREAVAAARFLITQFAATHEARDARCQLLIQTTLKDLGRLTD
jgi:hypothetical protein